MISCVKSKILKSAYHKATLVIAEDIHLVQSKIFKNYLLKNILETLCNLHVIKFKLLNF